MDRRQFLLSLPLIPLAIQSREKNVEQSKLFVFIKPEDLISDITGHWYIKNPSGEIETGPVVLQKGNYVFANIRLILPDESLSISFSFICR
jgi:hypothetical protein